eukprot:4947880-Lingulodinium_polyedra.AAC.1
MCTATLPSAEFGDDAQWNETAKNSEELVGLQRATCDNLPRKNEQHGPTERLAALSDLTHR